MTTDRLADLIAIAYNDWEGSTDSGMTMEEYVAARLIAAGVTVAPVDSGARQRLLDVIHGMDPQGIPPGGIEPLVDAAIRAGVTPAPPPAEAFAESQRFYNEGYAAGRRAADEDHRDRDKMCPDCGHPHLPMLEPWEMLGTRVDPMCNWPVGPDACQCRRRTLATPQPEPGPEETEPVPSSVWKGLPATWEQMYADHVRLRAAIHQVAAVCSDGDRDAHPHAAHFDCDWFADQLADALKAQPAPDALRAAAIDVERLAAALHNRATWTCREDCPASQWDYCDHEIAALAAAYGTAQPAPDALRAAAQAYLDAQEALAVWDAKHGYVINSERDALAGDVNETEYALRAALGDESIYPVTRNPFEEA